MKTTDEKMTEIVTAALFDFMGWATSRITPVTFSSAHDAAPAVEMLREWAKLRGFPLEDSCIANWQAALSQPAADGWKPSDEEVQAWNIRHDEPFQGRLDAARCAIDDARSMHLLAAAPTPPQEQSEAVEPVGYVTGDEMPEHRRAQLYPGVAVHPNAQLYTAHYSPAASQALRMAADVCRKQEENWARYPEQQDKAIAEQCRYLKNEILALIPPTESDQRKLGFEECKKLAAEICTQRGGPIRKNELFYARRDILALTPPTPMQAPSHSDSDTVKMTRELEKLIAAAESVCKSLEHPTESVNAAQMWNLRDALTAIVAQHMPEESK